MPRIGNISKAWTQPSVKGGNTLILISGNIASGKTVLSHKLSKDLGITYVEINNQFNTTDKDIILESTGLGYRTDNIKKAFKNVIIIKCEVSKSQALTNIKNRKKVFQPHEKRLGLSEREFYYHCNRRVQALKCNMVHDYTKDNYRDVLEFIRLRINARTSW